MTRAELFRYLAERAGLKRAPTPTRAAPSGEGSRAAGKNAAYALETSATRASRKSTRKSANRQKTDVQFRLKRRVAEVRPAPR